MCKQRHDTLLHINNSQEASNNTRHEEIQRNNVEFQNSSENLESNIGETPHSHNIIAHSRNSNVK